MPLKCDYSISIGECNSIFNLVAGSAMCLGTHLSGFPRKWTGIKTYHTTWTVVHEVQTNNSRCLSHILLQPCDFSCLGLARKDGTGTVLGKELVVQSLSDRKRVRCGQFACDVVLRRCSWRSDVYGVDKVPSPEKLAQLYQTIAHISQERLTSCWWRWSCWRLHSRVLGQLLHWPTDLIQMLLQVRFQTLQHRWVKMHLFHCPIVSHFTVLFQFQS
jgi:hypothetical protein